MFGSEGSWLLAEEMFCKIINFYITTHTNSTLVLTNL